MASIAHRVGGLGEYLREQREHAQLSLRQLASLAGVSNPYLSQIERGLKKPSAEVLQQIARGLQISSEALFVRAGILDEAEPAEVERAIHSDHGLSERQRRVLLDIYAAFRQENQRAAAAAEPPTTADGAADPSGAQSGLADPNHADPNHADSNPADPSPAEVDQAEVDQADQAPAPARATIHRSSTATLRRRAPKEKS